MVWFRENWYEELLRQLTEGLNRCQAVAFENRTDGELWITSVDRSCLEIIILNVLTVTGFSQQWAIQNYN